MQLRERLLLWWGRRHIGETIRRRAVHGAVRLVVGSLLHSTPSLISPSSLADSGSRFAREGERSLRILDAGCGRGDNALWVARTWPQAQVDAVDMDPALVALVERRVQVGGLRNVRAVVGDIATLQLPTPSNSPSRREGEKQTYAIIYSVDVFEHLKDPVAALRHLASLLASDGAIILHVPRLHQRRFFKRFSYYEQHDHEREGFAPEDISQIATASGLRVATLRHTFGPPGALAWELFHLAQGVGKWCVLLTYPVPWVLAQVDGWVRWRRGNGVLVTLQRSS